MSLFRAIHIMCLHIMSYIFFNWIETTTKEDNPDWLPIDSVCCPIWTDRFVKRMLVSPQCQLFCSCFPFSLVVVFSVSPPWFLYQSLHTFVYVYVPIESVWPRWRLEWSLVGRHFFPSVENLCCYWSHSVPCAR